MLLASSVAIGGILVLLVLLAVIGVVAWALITYIPMPQPIRGIIIVIAVLIALLVALNAFGMLGGGPVLIYDR